MIKGFEFVGEWWLPSTPENKIKGVLTFSPKNGGSLKLNSSLESNQVLAGNYEIIHGKSWDGKIITLCKCSGIISSLEIGLILEGRHFNSKEDLQFSSVNIRYSYLDVWLNKNSGFTVRRYIKEGVTDVSYRPRKPINIHISEDYSLEIRSDFRYQGLKHGTKHVIMQQDLVVNIASIGSKQERSFDEYMHIKNRFRDFLTLAVSESVQTLSFEGLVRMQKAKEDNSAPPDISVKIFYMTTNFVYPLEKISSRHILFTYRNISNRFAEIISNWYSKEENLRPVYDLYFGILHDPDMYLSNQFLSVMQAIETYHRRTRRNNQLPPENHKKRYNALVKALPEEHRLWLDQKFASSNERVLQERLEELINDVFARITDLLVEDKTEFIRDLRRTRNYFTHYDPEAERKATKDDDLARLTGRGMLLLQSCLLNELGFNVDQIESIVKNNKHYDYLKKQA